MQHWLVQCRTERDKWDGSKVSNFWQQTRAFMWLPIFSSNNTEVSGEAFLSTSKVVRPFGGRGSAPDPAGGAYSAPPEPLAGGDGAGCPLPNNSIPALGPSSLAPCGLRPLVSRPPSWNHEYPHEPSAYWLLHSKLTMLNILRDHHHNHRPMHNKHF